MTQPPSQPSPQDHTDRVLFETARLSLREFRPDDALHAHAWFSDPEVMRFIPGGADATVADTRKRIEGYAPHHRKHGFGKCAVVEKRTGLLIGDSGATWLEAANAFEVGYRFDRTTWGQGFASEVARGWLHHLARTTTLTEVIAYAHPEHRRSIHVLEKLGMTPRPPATFHGMASVVFGTPLSAWR